MDFDRYKNRLLDYLRSRGVDVSSSPISCFSPDHNDTEPSCQISEDHFHCHSGNCGIDGDIYDAIGILEGITEKKDQYLFAEKIFDGAGAGLQFRPAAPKPEPEKKEESFIRDPAAEKLLETYLSKNPAAEKAILQFLKLRATASTAGAVTDYPADLIPALVKQFFYWPGLDLVRRDLAIEVLRRCGVPLTHPKTGRSSWEHSGVIVKLGTGYKLHFYSEGICEKRGTKGCHTFPMPGGIDPAQPVILVEGEMNALACQAIGIKNLFSTGGTNAMTGPKVKEYLLGVPEIILFYDADEAGRKSSGLQPLGPEDKRKTNIPGIILKAGYTGIIKVAELPPKEETGCKDQDDLILAGKREIILKAIQEARPYTPPVAAASKPNGGWEAFDTLSLKRLKNVIGKIPREALDDEDIQKFITACIKACKHNTVKQELAKWGASAEEIEAKNDTSPYFLVEACGKYGVSKYIKNEIEKALIPASEILRRIKVQRTIVSIDFEKMETNENALQFLTTRGVRSAAQMVSDIMGGKMIYVESEKKHYFFNGHTWQREPDMAGVAYNIICAVMRHFLEKIRTGGFEGIDKGHLFDILVKIEGRRFRVELTQDFSGLPEVFRESVLFDGPMVRETLTLADGVLDFSGSQIEYRKSNQDEFRREILPYKMDDIKNAGAPEKFLGFMRDNFRDEKTLDTLMFYLSLIPSRNTQYKYGGIFVGKTHTGKTTTMELLGQVYPGMFDTIPTEIMVTKEKRRVSGNEATPFIARLEGKGVGIVKETDRNAFLNNALWKELTGGDTLTARGLYKEPHDFIPTAQILIYTNHQPRFDAHDEAAIDRMVIVPFMVQHEKGKKGTIQQINIYAKIRPEFPSIVKLMAEIYIKLKNEFGGAIPLSDECANYKNNYVKEQETDLDKFVNDNIDFDMSGGVFEPVQNVYERYLQYYSFTSEDKEAISRNKFTRYLKHDYLEINYKQKKINGEPVLCFFNMKLKPFAGKADQPIIQDDEKPAGPPPEKNDIDEEMPF